MSYILTHSGIRFDFKEPTVEMVNIEDIAHALGNLCRFTGHTKDFYSVAQHSIIVSRLLPDEYKLWGLLHDAPEAYVGDLNTPLKQIINGRYAAIERKIMDLVVQKFQLTPPEEPILVQAVDRAITFRELQLLVNENFLIPNNIPTELVEVLPIAIYPIVSEFAVESFLSTFNHLNYKRSKNK